MNEITPSAITQYQLDQRPQETNSNDLGQEDFLTLMLAQLQQQDPFKPMENGEFLGQMAQFSTVTGIEKMQQSLDQMVGAFGANQTLQATQLIGQNVMVEDNRVQLTSENAIAGRFDTEFSTGSVSLTISDSNGSLVSQINLGEHAAGRHDFSWDGIGDNGEHVSAGLYTISISSSVGDEQVALPVLLSHTVDSVEFGANGEVLLTTEDGNALTLDQVRQITQSDTSS